MYVYVWNCSGICMCVNAQVQSLCAEHLVHGSVFPIKMAKLASFCTYFLVCCGGQKLLMLENVPLCHVYVPVHVHVHGGWLLSFLCLAFIRAQNALVWSCSQRFE
jgi:hypothetical protein